MTQRLCMACLLAGLVTLGLTSTAQAAPPESQPGKLCFEAAYVREAADIPWQFRIVGNVPSLPGCYLIMHNAERILVKQHIPHGRHDAEHPFVIKVPADGVTGDYRVIILGYQNDILELNLPLTDLPLEVYGRRAFAAAADALLQFRAPRGVTSLTFSTYRGSLRVLENGRQLLDVKQQGTAKGMDWVAGAAVKPGADYRIDPYEAFYFSVAEGVYLCRDLSRWFAPDPKLDEVKWWQLLD